MSLTLTGIVYKRIYGYFGVYLDAVWNPVEDDIPLVKNVPREL
jgi:uncharacterized protein with HEPN domain